MSKKYILSFAPHVGTDQENGAIVKPKRDIIKGAGALGFREILKLEDLHYNQCLSDNIKRFDIIGRLRRKFSVSKALRQNLEVIQGLPNILKPEDVLLIQYPIYIDHSPDIFYELQEVLPRVTSKKIMVIHDLDSLHREDSNYMSINDESRFLSLFDVIITHNRSMTSYLQKSLLETEFIELNCFDYIASDFSLEKKEAMSSRRRKIFFAGNLEKATFLKEVGSLKGFEFHLYGQQLPKGLDSDNLFYHGSVSSQEILEEGARYDFGLVWDGTSIESLSGKFGDYMRYNNPYKMSSTIVSGLPIITSKDAGIAEFVEKNNLGITVSSLIELEDIIITQSECNAMRDQVLRWREKLMNGEVIQEVLQRILRELA